MTKGFVSKDSEVLKTLSDYGLLTISQLAILCFPSRQVTRKRTKDLARKGLIELIHRDFSHISGRPESIVRLSPKSLKLLSESEYRYREITWQHSFETGVHDIEHKLLINWTRLHLDLMERKASHLKAHFLSPQLDQRLYQINLADSYLGLSLIPDGIFSLSNTQQNKSLLFFLEVDMGTETLSSSRTETKDVRKKILSYQHIFKQRLYKRFENVFQSSFKGFRTLFMADTTTRQKQLCRLTQSIKSTNFIWLTDKESLFSNGISDRIWVKGGEEKEERYSILGPSLAFKCPLLPIK
jgi:hypothetical protein